MVKVILPHQIKYKGRYIQANTAFEIDDGDKKELLKMDGKIVEEVKNEPTSKTENSNPKRAK